MSAYYSELKKYLEDGGVLDAWAKCLVALHQTPEKPEEPIEFVEEFFGEKKNAIIAELTAKLEGIYRLRAILPCLAVQCRLAWSAMQG